MPFRLHYILLILLLASRPFTLQAQEDTVPVTKSSEKIILEGKIYYIHIVREGQTLADIARTYNVTEKMIAVENPDVFAGLRKGMALKIPSEPVVSPPEFTMQSDEFTYHVIKKGETLYSLAKHYGMTVDEISEYNPEVKYSELQINQVIKIPKKEKIPEHEFPGNKTIDHLVKKGETLYSLSRMYVVSEDEIRDLNPQLRWGKLKYDEYIKIPVHNEAVAAEDTATIGVLPDTLAVDSLESVLEYPFSLPEDSLGIFGTRWDELRGDSLLYDSLVSGNKMDTLNIGLFLPLLYRWMYRQEAPDTLEEGETQIFDGEEVAQDGQEQEEETGLNPRVRIFLEFYQGVLLAMDSLRQTGMSITLNVWDTEKNPVELQHLIDSIDMSDLDLIIGPPDPRNVRLLSEYSWEHRIPMVSPFYASDGLVSSNPFIVQIPPSVSVLNSQYTEYLSKFYDKTLVFIHSNDSLELPRSRAFREMLMQDISERTNVGNVLFKEIVINDSLPSVFSHTLTSDTENIVIVPSVEEGEVSGVLSGLYFQLEDYDIEVFGMPSWQIFGSIDLKQFHQLKVHFPTAFHVDYEASDVKRYIEKYRKFYNTEPYRITARGYNIGMLGYDVMMYFCPLTARYGHGLVFNLDKAAYKPMMGDYVFGKLSWYGGYVNEYSTMMKYNPDLSIEVGPVIHTSKHPPGLTRRF